MASRLKSIVQFTDVPAGESRSQLHRLNRGGLSIRPDVVTVGTSAVEFTAVADSTTITVTNNGATTASVEILLEAWHSTHRAFGGDTPPGTFYVTATGGGGGGGGSSNPITLPAVTDSGDEDEILAGNVFADASTTVGTLAVMQFTVAGQSGVYTAGQTASIPGRGTFSLLANGTYELIPFANYNGPIPVVTFQATNGSDIKIATLTMTVGAVNDPPVASDDARITLVDTPITINVLGTDQDPDSDAITVTQLNGVAVSVGAPVDIGDAVVTYQGSGNFLVTPDNAFEGEVSFTYTISDGTASDTATVTVLVGAANAPMFSAAAPISGVLGEAAYNFGLTIRGLYGNAYNNGVNVSIPPYSANQGLFDLTNREPWLYDRASTLYTLYLRTQDPAILEEAIALADLYFANVAVSGAGLGTFNIVGGDPGANPTDVKYLYPIIAVWYELETGSSVHRAAGIALYNQALASYSKTYNAQSAALWTERNTGYAIMACTSAYWLHRFAGNRAAAATALADAWDYVEMIESMAAVSGAPLHGHNQHEGSAITTPISSPWMSAILAEALLQLYRTDPDDRILTYLANYGDWLLDNAFYITDEGDIPEVQGLRLPAYLAADNATPTTYREGELLDIEHCPDVAGLIQKVIWAKTLLGDPVGDFETLLGELEVGAEAIFNYWMRDTEGYVRYRVNPPRKGNWWFRHTYSSTALFFTEQVPAKPLAVGTVTISGSTQQGQTLTLNPTTWDAFPAPVETYQWTRDGVVIAGATAATYATQLADVGAAIRGQHIATNAAGATTVTSTNAINVVAAGAPEITVHPVNDSALVGGTASFTATCDASPAATYQWQVSEDGSSWSNVVGGTGGSGSGNTTTYTTAALVEADNGNFYRCVFTNAGGSANTDAATLSLTVDQGAAEFAGNAEGAELTYNIGGAGHADATIEALMYFTARSGNAVFLTLRHSGNGRRISVGCNNVFEVNAMGPSDSNTGVTAWATQPPPDTWVHVTLQMRTIAGGDTVRATWALAEGVDETRTAATRANGIEDSVQGEVLTIGGLGIGTVAQPAFRVQYVRARTGCLDDAVVDGHRQDTDVSGWDYWLRFYDAGGGALGVEDLTGNNRVPTITGGSFASGPVVPSAG